jgi:uncharacterized protein
VNSAQLTVLVVYALPQRATEKSLSLAAPATVGDALALALRDPDFAAIDLEHAAVGIFGVPVARGQLLRDGDRIEIYRALALDPKAARRQRVELARAAKRQAPAAKR